MLQQKPIRVSGPKGLGDRDVCAPALSYPGAASRFRSRRFLMTREGSALRPEGSQTTIVEETFAGCRTIAPAVVGQDTETISAVLEFWPATTIVWLVMSDRAPSVSSEINSNGLVPPSVSPWTRMTLRG